jgi:HD-GYP domain-containing protein (c-di-GMP phosphodiesterase class II)
MSHEQAKGIVLEGRGKHFDPRIVDAFQARESQFIAFHNQHHIASGFSPIHQVMQKIQGQTTN